MRRAIVLVVTFFAVLATRVQADEPAPGAPSATESFTLENRLRVFIRPIPGAVGAFVHVLYDIGEEDDPPGRSGIARVMDALYTSCPAGDVVGRYDHAVGHEYDGRHESEVQDDYTAFCEGAPADRLRLILREAAARMGDLRIEAPDLHAASSSTERRFPLPFIGIEARDAARARLAPLSGGGRREGIPSEIRALDLATVRERWRRYYKPVNAVLTVVGNVDPSLVRAGVRRLFGAIPPGEPISHIVRTPRQGQDAPLVLRTAGPHAEDLHPEGPLGAACLAVEGPPLSSPRGIAAALVLTGRLRRDDPVGEPLPLDRDQWMARWKAHVSRVFRRMGEGVTYHPLKDAGTISLVTMSSDVGADGRALETLRRRLLDAAAAPVDDDDVRYVQNLVLQPPLSDRTEEYPCLVALGIARRAQLGIDWAVVRPEVALVSLEDLAAAAARPAAGAIVLPRSP